MEKKYLSGEIWRWDPDMKTDTVTGIQRRESITSHFRGYTLKAGTRTNIKRHADILQGEEQSMGSSKKV